MLSNQIVRDDRGIDRCSRQIMKAVANVPNDPSKGYKNIPAYCGQPITQRISDGVKACPNCDREPPVGNVHPKTTNSAGIALTEAELKECGVTEDTSLKQVETKKVAKKPKEKKAVEAKVYRAKKDIVEFAVTLDQLEQTEDLTRLLIKAASDSLDKLPVTNFAESKRLMKLQERLEALLGV